MDWGSILFFGKIFNFKIITKLIRTSCAFSHQTHICVMRVNKATFLDLYAVSPTPTLYIKHQYNGINLSRYDISEGWWKKIKWFKGFQISYNNTVHPTIVLGARVKLKYYFIYLTLTNTHYITIPHNICKFIAIDFILCNFYCVSIILIMK